jgi:RNA-directed DNA polymerase
MLRTGEIESEANAWGNAQDMQTDSRLSDWIVQVRGNVKTMGNHMVNWKDIGWKKFHRHVYRLQKRIFKASQRGDVGTMRRLQKLLMKSYAAKCLAVRRVTQDNQGKSTAGVDGVKSLTPKQRLELVETLRLGTKAKATRRVMIPKPGKAEKRPLGIPTMSDRSLQCLVKLALEPELGSTV